MTLRIVATLLVVLVAATQTFAQAPSPRERTAYRISVALLIGTGAADIATTHRAVDLGAQEGNPVLRRLDGTPSYVRKVVIVTGVGYGAHRWFYRRGHPRWAIAANLGVSAIQIWAAAHNRRVIRSLEPGELARPRARVAITFRF